MQFPRKEKINNRQLNDCLNSKGEKLVFVLNNLLNDCGCSNPNL